MEHLCQPLLRTIIMIAWIGLCAFPLKAQTLEGEITARDVLPPVAIDLFLNEDNQLLKSSITALATDNSGKLWIGTMGSGAKVLNTNTWHLVHIGETGDNNRDASSYIHSIAIHNGYAWIATRAGLRIVHTETLAPAACNDVHQQLLSAEVSSITASQRSSVIIEYGNGTIAEMVIDNGIISSHHGSNSPLKAGMETSAQPAGWIAWWPLAAGPIVFTAMWYLMLKRRIRRRPHKPEEPPPPLQVRHGECVRFISEVIASFHDLAEKKRITLQLRPQQPEITGWFDPDKLEKVIRNLICNALVFTPDRGQIVIVAEQNTSASGDGICGESLAFTITHGGPASNANELKKIFHNSAHHESVGAFCYEGKANTIAYTRALLDQQRGTMQLRAATIVVTIPICKAAYSDNERVSSNAPGAHRADVVRDPSFVAVEPCPGMPSVLLIEDSADMRNFLSVELANEYAVTACATGEEGYLAACDKIPDLIISDIVLRGKSGLSLCEEIRKDSRTSHIPLILLTAKCSTEDQVTGLGSGADVYMTKPFSLQILKAQIRQVITSRRHLHARYSQDAYIMPSNTTDNPADKQFMTRVVDYVSSNLRDPQLSVESIADAFSLSRSQVYRKVKSLTGQTVVEFIRTVRLKHALTLMEEKKYNLTEVADRSGFNSLSYFTRSFKDKYGVAPSEVRN